jgi:hypothetical protein
VYGLALTKRRLIQICTVAGKRLAGSTEQHVDHGVDGLYQVIVAVYGVQLLPLGILRAAMALRGDKGMQKDR